MEIKAGKSKHGSFIMWDSLDKRWNQKGFTLPELLVTICLTSFLLSFFLTCFFTISDSYKHYSAMLELQDNLLSAVELLTTDIAGSTAVIECAADGCTLQQENCIYYSLGKDQQYQEHFYRLEGKILYRRESMQKNRQPMANFLDTLEFRYLDQNGVPTEQCEDVRAIQFLVSGSYLGQRMKLEQIVRLAGALYV